MTASSLSLALLREALEGAVARFLALDPRAGELLGPLQGRVLALRFAPFAKNLYLYPTATGIQIHGRFERAPDVVLSGTPWAFARTGFGSAPGKPSFGDGVCVEGDGDLAKRFSQLLGALQIDWEGQLAGALGRDVADLLVSGVNSARRWGKESLATLGLNIAEYLQEESRDLPAVPEANAFLRDVDMLRADCDRLEVRIRQLSAVLQTGAAQQESP